jgi:GTP1/Obg family GTP-binding protein
MFKKSISEAKTLEQYRVALKNAESQPKIASTLAEFGYDRATVATGKALYETTRQAFDSNKTETDQALAAYAVFDAKKAQLDNLYSLHRRKAKVVFLNDQVTADKLSVSGSIPGAYTKWLETVRKFYTTAIADAEIQTKLGRLKITLAELNATQALIAEVETLRAAYLKEKGESQDATAIKDSAFARLDDWMREFYAVAKIALEENPQLLESLGKVVKG